MKRIKILGLGVAAAMALMAFAGAGPASATTLSSSAGNYPKETPIDFTQAGAETSKFETLGGTILEECSGITIKGKTVNETGETVSGPIESLTWEGCTHTSDTTRNGSLSVRWSSGTSGTVTGSGSEWTDSTIFGSCDYGTSQTGTSLGTLVGGRPATLRISAIVPLIEGGFTCPKEVRWTANFTVTSPSELLVTS